MPILKIFDISNGAREVAISGSKIVLGRSKNAADISLIDNTVSRKHAIISYNGQNYTLKDLGSTFGTLLNNKKITEAFLQYGDNIQLGSTVIEFTEGNATNSEEDYFEEGTLDFLSKNFKTLPSGMKLKCRILRVSPQDIFSTGDTIVLGSGGLMISQWLPCSDQDNILELNLIWPDGNSKLLLGEIIAVINKPCITCIKLHVLPELKFAAIMNKVERGVWIDIQI